jgi:hypothetical protein
MRIEFNPDQIGTGKNALEIGFHGFKANPADDDGYPSQVLIEVLEGKLHVHVWDGSPDPQSIIIQPDNSTSVLSPTALEQASRRFIVGNQPPPVRIRTIDLNDTDKLILRKRILAYVAEGSRWMYQVVTNFEDANISKELISESVAELVKKGIFAINEDGLVDLSIPT